MSWMYRFAIIYFLMATSTFAQIPNEVFKQYDQYREASIEDRRFKHEDIKKLLLNFSVHREFALKEEGKSLEGREIYSLKYGNGPVNVLLWSQMHGDEATATMALMDIFNFLIADDEFNDFRNEIKEKLTLTFIPLLNPDGAARFTRRTALGVDMNRDALRLQSPESPILKRLRDETDAVFGFNLHDQSRAYSVGNSNKQATISFLAPAYNYEKDINSVRTSAMQLIGELTETLQEYIPGHIAKYSDDFEPRAFGDNIAKWGTSLVLIESGGYPNDREKQEIRKMNFLALLKSFESISSNSYAQYSTEIYDSLPFNERLFFDLLIKGVTVELKDKSFILDLAINQAERDYNQHREYYLNGEIVEVGDLSIYYGYEFLDGQSLKAEAGKVYPDKVSKESLQNLDVLSLLKQGYLYIEIDDQMISEERPPLNVISGVSAVPTLSFKIGDEPNFILKDEYGNISYIVLNGFLIDLKNPDLEGVYGLSYGF